MTEGIVKDSLYGWMLCFVALLLGAVWAGLMNIFGVFFVEFLKTFDGSKSDIAWLGSLAWGVSLALGPVSCRIRLCLGDRMTVAIGCLTCSASLIISSFVYRWQLMFATYSIMYGVGSSLIYMSCINIPTIYFEKHVALVTGFIVSGCSIGTLMLSFLCQYMVDEVGWRNTWRLFAGLLFLGTITGSLFKVPTVDQTQVNIDASYHTIPLWRNRVFIIWVIAISLVFFGYYVPYVYMVSYAMDVGISPKLGASLISILGGVGAVGRILFGKVVNMGYLNRLHMHQFAMIITGSAMITLPILTTYNWLVFYCVLSGLMEGCNMVLVPILTTSFADVNQKGTALGILYGFTSVTYTLGPPVTGWIYDYTGSYLVAFHVSGIAILLSAAILFFIPWAQRTTAKSHKHGNAYDQLGVEFRAGALNPVMTTENGIPGIYNCVEISPQLVHNQEIRIEVHNEPDLTKDCARIDSLQKYQTHLSQNQQDNGNINVVSQNNEATGRMCDLVLNTNMSVDEGSNDVSNSPVIIPNSVVEVLESLAKKEGNEYTEDTRPLINELPTQTELNALEEPHTVDVDVSPHVIIPDSVVEVLENLSRKDESEYVADKDLPTSELVSLASTPPAEQMFVGTEGVTNAAVVSQLSHKHDEENVLLAATESANNQTSTVCNNPAIQQPSPSQTCQTPYSFNISSVSNHKDTWDTTDSDLNFAANDTALDSALDSLLQTHDMTETGSTGNEASLLESLLTPNMATETALQADTISRHTILSDRKLSTSEHNDDGLLLSPQRKPSKEYVCETESSTMDITELAAENLAQFEEDLGIVPAPPTETQILQAGYQTLDSTPSNIEDCQQQSNQARIQSDFEPRSHNEYGNILLSAGIDENGLFDSRYIIMSETKTGPASVAEDVSTVNISELAAENLAQFEEDLGITPTCDTKDDTGQEYQQEIHLSSLDISELAAENLAQFEEDLGITPTNETQEEIETRECIEILENTKQGFEKIINAPSEQRLTQTNTFTTNQHGILHTGIDLQVPGQMEGVYVTNNLPNTNPFCTGYVNMSYQRPTTNFPAIPDLIPQNCVVNPPPNATGLAGYEPMYNPIECQQLPQQYSVPPYNQTTNLMGYDICNASVNQYSQMNYTSPRHVNIDDSHYHTEQNLMSIQQNLYNSVPEIAHGNSPQARSYHSDQTPEMVNPSLNVLQNEETHNSTLENAGEQRQTLGLPNSSTDNSVL